MQADEQQIIFDLWPQYFPNEEPPSNGSDAVLLQAIELFAQFFSNWTPTRALDCSDGQVVFSLDSLCAGIKPHVQDFQTALVERPDETLPVMGIALCVVRARRGGLFDRFSKIAVRIKHFHPETPLQSLKSNVMGFLVSVRGTVVRVGAVSPMVKDVKFICPKCGISITQQFVDGKYEPPTRCTPPCRGKQFVMDRTSAKTVDSQSIKIQEIDDARSDANDTGRVPRTI